MTNYSIELKDVIKFFGRRLIFGGINYSFSSQNVYGISGPNGSGKSTIVKIISGIISPTKGKIIHTYENGIIDLDNIHEHLGFVSPYLVMYDEFSAEENLMLSSKIRGLKYEKEIAAKLLDEFGLYNRKDDFVRGYSSGMKQRLKFAFALLHQPQLLILDEPTSNLDNDGKEKVYKMVERERENKLIIVASNEDTDLALCNYSLNLDDYKSKRQVK